MGTFALVQFVINEVVEAFGREGSRRGLARTLIVTDRFAIANSIAALFAGAECVHATALGIGERVGNTQMDLMLMNLKLMGIPPWADQDLTKLKEYCVAVSRATGDAYSGKLSGGGGRCIPHRDRGACRRRDQGLQEE